jgi:hypothetical protein
MGSIKHNAFIVTADDYAIKEFDSVYDKAKELFGKQVSDVVTTKLNGHLSFFVATDGSKEGWPEAICADTKRKELADYIDSLAYDDGSNAISFVNVSYDGRNAAEVVRGNKAKLNT